MNAQYSHRNLRIHLSPGYTRKFNGIFGFFSAKVRADPVIEIRKLCLAPPASAKTMGDGHERQEIMANF
jgi:hypothetical protein